MIKLGLLYFSVLITLFSVESQKMKAETNTEEDLKEEESRIADMKRQKKQQKNRKRLAQDEDEQPVDDELMKMMGLSGFGGSKKNN